MKKETDNTINCIIRFYFRLSSVCISGLIVLFNSSKSRYYFFLFRFIYKVV